MDSPPLVRAVAAVRAQFGVWRARLAHPRVQRVARTGGWALRLLRWRQMFQRAARVARLARRRREIALLRVLYAVLPLAPFRWRALRTLRVAVRRPTQEGPARARIIANPYSGTMIVPGMLDELQETADWLTTNGMPTELCLTERPGHATELAREAVRAGAGLVVAAGGDGTVNDVIQALAGHTTALGVLPLGTVNVWAREMGIPLDLRAAGALLLKGARRQIDLGKAGNRFFLLMAGIGFDAEVARRVEHSRLKRAGLKLLDYFAVVGMLSLTQRPARIWIRREGKRRATRSLMVIIGNTRLYGGALTFTPRAVADDGLLDVAVFGGGGPFYRAGVLVRALLRQSSGSPRVRYERCRSIRIESDTPLPVQVDGEVVGTLPLTFTVAPLALTVIVPRSAPDALFSREPLTP